MSTAPEVLLINGPAFFPAERTAEEESEATADSGPLAVACLKCRAAAGEPCRNYKRQRKQTCPARGKPIEQAAEKRPAPIHTLFGEE